MRIQTTRGRLLASTMICGAAFAALATAAPAFAQDDTEVGEVFITGSRIPQPNLVTTSPITQVTSEDIQTQGVTRVEDLVNQLPQAFAAQNSSVSNGASGTATVDLRGIGSDRTLVLIDGRRMPYGSPNDSAADLNQIPGGLVERVEVLTGGASAVYGSDAIAGVVNFIMKRDFEGVQLDAQYSFYQHHNDFDGKGNLRKVIAARALTNPTQFQLPDDNVIDGYGKEFTILMGISSPDDKGNLTAYASWRNNDAILQADRDYSACSIGAAGATAFTCGGSSTNASGRFTSLANGANLTVGNTPGVFRNYVGAQDQYNFGPLNFYQRPDERYSLGAIGRYEVNEHAEVFTQLMFTDYTTVAQIAPSGVFYGGGPSGSGGFNLSCSNPLLTATQKTQLGCVLPTDSVEVLIGRRNVEGGPRQDDLRYQSFRALFGVRGDIGGGWSYDIAGQYSRVQLSRVYRNEFSATRIARALDVVAGPGGAPICRTAIDPDGVGPLAAADAACRPYNPFAAGGVTQEALDYVQIPGVQSGATTQQVVTASVAGDLGEYGIKSPLATNGIQVAFGAEYRRDSLESTTDTAFSTGDLFGQGGPTIGFSGDTEVYDLFAEARLPLIEDMPGAKLLTLELAYRFSDYGTGINTDTYKVGGDWSPIESVRLRASFQRAVRAPNVIDLFTAEGLGLFDLDEDPCGLSAFTAGREADAAVCLATGVPFAALYTDLLDSPAGQYNQLNSGTANLEPESADTYTLGLVFQPTFLPGFNASVDYFNIDLTNRIDTIDPLVTVNQCYYQGSADACARVTRSNIGTFWTAGGFIEARNTNIGGLKTSGYDVNVNYAFDIGDWGGLDFNFVGTYLSELETDPGVGPTAIYDCVGYYGNECGTPNPEWRHRLRAAWSSPWDVNLAVTWRYYGEVELFDFTATNRVDRKFDAENYIDLYASWKANDTAAFRIGVNNVFDNDPQLSASVGTTGNGNTYPQTYDALGRYIFMGVTLDF